MTNVKSPDTGFINVFILSLLLGIAGTMLTACAHTVAPTPDAASSTARTSHTSKISPLLQSAAQQLLHGTPSSVFHGGLVRADDQGRLQVYVYVNKLTPDIVSNLTAKGLENTVASPALHVVQGWIRPQDLDTIAALPFVIRITPPKYAQPR